MLLLYAIFTAAVYFAQTCYGQQLIGEGCFLVDDKAVRTYMKWMGGNVLRSQAVAGIQKDLEYILTEANVILATLKAFNIDFQVRVKETIILDVDLFKPKTPGITVPDSPSLNAVSNWKVAQNRQLDFVLLFTGYDLEQYAGIAGQGGVCDALYGSSIVEFRGIYFTAMATAHEIGHLIGAAHDGFTSDYVMSSDPSPFHKNRWFFSATSGKEISSKIALLGKNSCLHNTDLKSKTPSMTWASYSGDMLSHKKVCERLTNDSRSGICLDNTLYKNQSAIGDPICTTLWCLWPNSFYCNGTYTPEGLICAKGKRCDNGKCVPDSSAAAANVDAECVFGDVVEFYWLRTNYSGTCNDYITRNGKAVCYNENIRQQCCTYCRKLRSTTVGCEYGDRVNDCRKQPQSTACTQNKVNCCEYCKGFTGKRSVEMESDFDVQFISEPDPEKYQPGVIPSLSEDRL